MKKWIATLLNFFLPGLGYLVLKHKVVQSIGWLIGVIGLSYVEFGIQKPMPRLYWIMFTSVLLMNTMFAIDAWNVAKELEE
jgi:hypothetical protein